MKLNEIQAQMLLQVCIDSLRIHIRDEEIFALSYDYRFKLMNEIINQQSKDLKEVDKQ